MTITGKHIDEFGRATNINDLLAAASVTPNTTGPTYSVALKDTLTDSSGEIPSSHAVTQAIADAISGVTIDLGQQINALPAATNIVGQSGVVETTSVAQRFSISGVVNSSSTDATLSTSKAVYDLLGSITVSRANQTQIVYFGKHGNDSNSGTNDDNAFYSITAAVAKAKTLTGNVVVYCADANTYDGDLTGSYALYRGISIYAPNASITGDIEINDNSTCIVCALNIGTSSNICTVNNILSGMGTLVFYGINTVNYFSYLFNVGACNIKLFGNHVFTAPSSCVFTSSGNTLSIAADYIGALTATDTTLPTSPVNIVAYNSGLLLESHSIEYAKVKGFINYIRDGANISFTNNCNCELTISSTESLVTADDTISGKICVTNNLTGSNLQLEGDPKLLTFIDCSIPQNFVVKNTNNSGDAQWYLIGSQSFLADSYVTYNIKLFSPTIPDLMGITNFTVSANATGYSNVQYKVESGSLPMLRGIFRVYNDTSGYARVYMKIPDTYTYELISTRASKGSLNFVNSHVFSGIGPNPAGTTGYILEYDSSTDDVLYTSGAEFIVNGPFLTYPYCKIQITALNEGSLDISFSGFESVGSGASSYITLPDKVIPDKYLNTNDQYSIVPVIWENSSSIITGTLKIDSSGYITIYKSPLSMFSTVVTEGFVIKPFIITYQIFPA